MAERLVPPPGCMTVRLYRIGHGDCFLLAFPGQAADRPVYVLIDCGYKPGSPKFIDTTAKEVCRHLHEATGGHIDVVVVTHEHQDHVNGFTKDNFEGFTFGEAWFAWTEDPEDDDADALRRRFKDRLLFLVEARHRLAADAGAAKAVEHIDDFLAFELGGDDEVFRAPEAERLLGAGEAAMSQNKRAMQLVKTLAGGKVSFLRPHEKALKLPGVASVRVYPLGPPRDEALLHSLDPLAGESFHDEGGHAFSAASRPGFLAAAVRAPSAQAAALSPFGRRWRIERDHAFEEGGGSFFDRHYGTAERADGDAPAWRRIDKDWLYPAEQLALDMNNDTNNGSLVLAFELAPGGRVLLFAADAQRGNWVSWGQGSWKDGARTVTAQDLLGRTVLYKVGHHGSHNATLHGDTSSEHANLGWMAQGEFAPEFTAMITAVRPWAETQKGWDHPLQQIKDALLGKASGRVFQTDTDVEAMKRHGTKAAWAGFQARVRGDRLFVDYDVPMGD